MNQSELSILSPDEAAIKLLGAKIISTIEGVTTSGMIVETEAYLASDDLAAHSARGKTGANKSLFEDAGTLYVHSMRHHNLVDIVVGNKNNPGSVLIRAIEPMEGIRVMEKRRNVSDKLNLCSGPGKVCKALGITKEIDGLNLFSKRCPIKIEPFLYIRMQNVIQETRIGITKDTDKLLRFYIKDSVFISQKTKMV